jgi:hypothetical protein
MAGIWLSAQEALKLYQEKESIVKRNFGGELMVLKTPQSLKAEHDELHAQLARAIGAGGATGEAAAKVADALHPHFLKEEEYALPPLGLLPDLSEGRILPEMEAAVEMSHRLKADLGHMLLEHKQIVAALKALTEAANSEGKGDAAHFAEKLMLHAQTEEEVLYPASILVGKYLNLKLSEGTGR